ncbi:hypothetical protein PMAYCL1PPCAC_04317, partial [Pristionchus mayeri]
ASKGIANIRAEFIVNVYRVMGAPFLEVIQPILPLLCSLLHKWEGDSTMENLLEYSSDKMSKDDASNENSDGETAVSDLELDQELEDDELTMGNFVAIFQEMAPMMPIRDAQPSLNTKSCLTQSRTIMWPR